MPTNFLNFLLLLMGIKEIVISIKLFKTNRNQAIFSLIAGLFVCVCYFLSSTNII